MANGGWIGLTAGLISASFTLGAGSFLEDYKRHRDRRALAAALVGEIKTLVDLSQRLMLPQKAREIADAMRSLKEVPPDFGTSERIALGNPVFDKTADRIGLFPGDIPMLISEFYNYIVGLRVSYFSALMSGPMNPQARVALLDFVVSRWPELEALANANLIPKLQVQAKAKWLRGGQV